MREFQVAIICILFLFIAASGCISSEDEDNTNHNTPKKDNTFKGIHHDLNSTQRWNFVANGPVNSAITVGDLDNKKGLEVIVGTDNHTLMAIDSKGELFWKFSIETGYIRSSILIKDLDRDERLEVVFCTIETVETGLEENVNLNVLDGPTGELIWSRSIGNGNFPGPHPTICDFENDGNYEILVACNVYWTPQFYAFNQNGTLLWKRNLTGADAGTAITAADLDNDEKLELIFIDSENYLWVFNEKGEVLLENQLFDWYGNGGESAVGDIDNDGFLEFVTTDQSGTITAFDHDLQQLWQAWDEEYGYIRSAPVIGDINNDGVKDILVNNVDHKLSALYPNGTIQWETNSLRNYVRDSSMVVVDFEGDGFFEIILQGWIDLTIYNHKGERREVLFQSGYSSPVVADINGDKIPELITGDRFGNVNATSIEGSCFEYEILWGAFNHDMMHTGCLDAKSDGII